MNTKSLLLASLALVTSYQIAASADGLSAQFSAAVKSKDKAAFVTALQALYQAQMEAQAQDDASELASLKGVQNDAYNDFPRVFAREDGRFPVQGSDPDKLDLSKINALVQKFAPSMEDSDSDEGFDEPTTPSAPTPATQPAPTRSAPQAQPIQKSVSQAQASGQQDTWFNTLMSEIRGDSKPVPSRPQPAPSSTKTTMDLAQQLSQLSDKQLADVLRDVANKTAKPKPTLTVTQGATVGVFLKGLYTALDTLESLINQVANGIVGSSVSGLKPYLRTRLLTIAGKLG